MRAPDWTMTRGIVFCVAMALPVSAAAEPPRLVVQTGHVGRIRSIDLSPDGKTAATCGEDSTVILWDVATGTELRALKAPGKIVDSVAFSPDGRLLAGGASDGVFAAQPSGVISLWDPATGTLVRELRGHAGDIHSLAFSPDGRTLLSASSDGTVRIWDVVTGQPLRSLTGPMCQNLGFNAASFSPDGKLIAAAGCGSGSGGLRVMVWESESGREVRSWLHGADAIGSLAFSPDGKFLVVSHVDGGFNQLKSYLTYWDLATWKDKTYAAGDGGNFALHPDLTVAYTDAGDDVPGTIRLIGAPPGTATSFPGKFTKIIFSRDGKLLAAVGPRPAIFNFPSGKRVSEFTGHVWSADRAALSPAGTHIASASGSLVAPEKVVLTSDPVLDGRS